MRLSELLDPARREIILDLIMRVNARQDLSSVFPEVGDLVLSTLGHDYSALWMYEPDRRFVRAIGTVPASMAPPPERDVVTDATLGVSALEPGGTEFVPSKVPGRASLEQLTENGVERVVAVPLIHGGKTYGSFSIGKRQRGRFSQEDRAFAAAVGEVLAGAAYEEAQVHEARQAAARSAVLNELAILLNAGEAVESIARRLPELLRAAINFSHLHISLPAGDGRLRVVANEPQAVCKDVGEIYSFDDGQVDVSMAQGTGVYQYRPERVLEGEWPQAYAAAGIRRVAVAMFRQGHNPLGALSLGRRRNFAFPPEEMAFLEVVATLMAHAVAAERRLGEARSDAGRATVLNELALALTGGEAFSAVARRLPALLSKAVDFDFVHIDETTAPELFRVVLQWPHEFWGPVGTPTTFEEAQVANSLREGNGVYQYRPDRVEGAGPDSWRRQGVTRVLAALLRNGDAVEGEIFLGRCANERFTAEDLRFMEVVQGLAGQALAAEHRLTSARLEAARNRALSELAMLLNEGKPIEEIFHGLPALLAEALPLDYISLGMRDGDVIRLVGAIPSIDISDAGQRASLASVEQGMGGRDIGEWRPDRTEGEVPAELLAAGYNRALTAILRQGDELLGSMTIARRENVPFPADDQAFVKLVGTLVSQSIAMRRRAETARLESGRSKLLNELSLLLNAGEPVERLFHRLPELLRRALPFDYIGLTLLDADGRVVRVGSEPPIYPDPLPESDSLPFEAILRGGRGYAQFRPERSQNPWSIAYSDAGLKRVLASVLMQGGQRLGLLGVGRLDNVPFTEDEVAFLEVVTTFLSQAVASHRRIEHAQADARRSQLLNELALLLNQGEAVDTLFDRLLRLLNRAVAFNYLGLAVASDQPGIFNTVRYYPGEEKVVGSTRSYDRIEPLTSGAANAILYRAPEMADDPGFMELQAEGVRAGAILALRSDGQFLGMLHIGRAEDAEFPQEDLDFLELVATFLGQAVGNQKRLQRSQSEANRNRLLNELSILLNAGEPVERLFDSAQELVRQAISLNFVALVREDTEGSGLRVVGALPRALTRHSPGDHYSDQGLGALQRSGLRSFQYRTTDLDNEGSQLLREIGMQRACAALVGEGSRASGMLIIARQNDARFTPEEVAFIELLATLFGQAVASQRRVSDAAREARRANLLNELSIILNAGEPLESLSERLPELLSQVLSFTHFALFARTTPGGGIEPLGLSPEGFLAELTHGAYQADNTELLQQAHGGHAVGQLRPEFLRDGQLSAALAQAGVARGLATALRNGHETVGILGIGRDQDQPFSPEEERFVELVGTFVGQAIGNHLRLLSAEQEADEQRIIAEVAATAARETGVAELVAAIARPIRAFIPGAFVGIGLREGDAVVYPRVGAPPIRNRVGPYSLLTEALGQISGDQLPADADQQEFFAQIGLRSVSLTLCQAGGEVIGYLLVGSRREGFSFGERDLRLLRLIANIAAPALSNARAAEEVGRERALYELALSSLTEAVILLDHDMHTVFANEAGWRIIRMVDPDQQLRTVEDHLPRVPDGSRQPLAQAMLEGLAAGGRARLDIDGQPAWFDFEFVPLDHPNLKLLIVASDVTAKVVAEGERERHREEMEQAARLAALGELIGGVAHELNNPLTAILGFAELIATSPEAESLEEEVGVIRKEALRARDIVRDLLFIARPGPVERAPVNLAEVVGHIERLRRPFWAKQGIAANVGFDGSEHRVWGNEHQLTQVLLNLVTNAEHALRDTSGPCLRIGTTVEGENAVITVSDNGHGMDDATVARVFEPFFTTKQGQGTGLGLSLSYTIVSSHEGRLEVESTPGVGTTFRVVLPLQRQDSAEVVPVLPPTGGRRLRVLVVDDEPSLRAVCERLIAAMGQECETAPDAESAIELAASRQFDLVLCDYRLANDTAADVVAGLERVAPHLVARTVIATGATTDAGVVAVTEQHGLRLIAKPYGFEDIAKVLEEVGRAAPA